MNHSETVLITGATSGIGRAMAFTFAKKGYCLIINGRNQEKLEALAKELKRYSPSVKILLQDLLAEDAAETIINKLENNQIQIDILVQNAGFGVHGPFTQTEAENELAMIQLHIVFLTKLTKYILVQMEKRRKGKILLVASTAGFCPTALMSVYSATKGYVLNFGAALREECRGTGVAVSILCPGATDTQFSGKAHMKNTLLFHLNVMQPRQVAEIAYNGLMAGKSVIIPGVFNTIQVVGSRLLPLKWVAKMSKVLTHHR